MPPANETPPGPISVGMNVWPSPTKTPLVDVSAERRSDAKRCLMRSRPRVRLAEGSVDR